MSKNYIYSTLAAPQAYTNYSANPSKELSVPQDVIVIKGGAGVVGKENFYSPKGVLTEVNDEQLAALEKVPAFNEHVKNGFIVVEKRKEEADKVADDMNRFDDGRQIKSDEFVKDSEGRNHLKRGKKHNG